MTVDQVKKMREFSNKDDGQGRTMAFSLSAIFNNEIAFNNTDQFVIYDDSNALIHCLQPNTNDVVQSAVAPYKINTGFYDNIQYMEGLYTMDNFGTAVQELFLDAGLINQDQYDSIMKWASTINNSVPDADPVYFKETVKPIPKVPVRLPRKDGVEVMSTVANHSSKDMLINSIVEYMEGVSDENLVQMGKLDYTYVVSDPDALKTTINDAIVALSSSIEGFEKATVYTYANTPTAEYWADTSRNTRFDINLINLCKSIKKTDTTRIRIGFKNKLSRIELVIVVDPSFAEVWNAEADLKIINFLSDLNVPKITYGTNRDVYVDINDNVLAALKANGSSIKNFFDSMKGTIAILTSDNNSSSYASGGDDTSYEEFKLGLLNVLPDSNDIDTTNFTITIERGTNMALVYKFSVTYKAPDEVTVNGVSYHTLAEALAGCEAGATIALSRDIEISDVAGLIATKDCTIEFGDYVMTCDGKGLEVQNGANVVINANEKGGIAAGEGASYVAVMARNGNLTINGGTYSVGVDDKGEGNSCVYLMNESNITINGGNFSTAAPWGGKYYVLNSNNAATGKFTITGGTYKIYDPETGDDFLDGTYVAEGYISVDNGDGTFTVREMTEAEKIAASEVDAEVDLDSFLAELNVEGFEIVESENNTYNIVTDQQSFDQTGIIDQFVAVEDLVSIEATDGNEVATLADPKNADEVAAFKAAVDAMIPDDGNTAEIVMTLNF